MAAVISMCSLKHLHVWKLTSRLLPRFVKADSYTVYVPVEEIEEFKSITPAPIEVRSQSDLGRNYAARLEQRVFESGNSQRFGWYLQQLFKIEALCKADDLRVVIWDADCVPVKPIEVFDSEGRAIYMKAVEYHQDYFDMIHRLLGLSRIQDFSFVIPPFPAYWSWISDFIERIEELHPGETWFDAIILSTELGLKAGFSETETLGTWIAHHYPGEWVTANLRWERRGQNKFGYAKNLTPDDVVLIGVKNDLDIISFENWDDPKFHKKFGGARYWMRRLKNFRGAPR